MPEDAARRPAGPRPFWSGTIAFGLVSLPVSLFPAHRPGRPSLRMTDADGTPLRRRYFCTREGVPLARDDIVRGYPVGDGAYVVMTEEELEELAPERSREIDLKRFVALNDLDPVTFERAYFLTPDQGSTKAYRLLARAMEDAGRAGIASFVMRGTEYLVAILAVNGILRAQTLRFAGELRSPADVGLAEAEPDEGAVDELRAALDELATDALEPGALEDAEAERLRELVDAKLEAGDDVVAPPEGAEPDEETPVDLMQVLKASLRRGRDGGATDGEGAPGDGLADLTKRELYALAQDRDIEGRSQMTKDELVDALEA